LIASGVEFEAIDYVEDPLSADALKQLLRSARLRPRDAIRMNEAAYRQHVAGRNLSDEQLVSVMVEHPEIIQRPIVVRGNKAVLARSVDKLVDLGIE
jgi:arsenate reductase (glutaredoxin)